MSVLPACGPENGPPGSVEAALTAEQCRHFEIGGKVQICHRTGSTKNPYTILRTSVQGCADGHAGHAGDYVASTDPSSPLYDPTCKGLGCFPAGAPFDGSVECCDYLWPDATGHCAPIVCPADTACVSYTPNATGGGCTAHVAVGATCDDGLVTTVGDACTAAGTCAGGLCEGGACIGTGETKTGGPGAPLGLEGVSFVVPATAPPLAITSSTATPPSSARNGAALVAYSPIYQFGPSGTTFASPLEVRFAIGSRTDLSVFWTEDGTTFEEVDAALDGSVLVVATSHFSGAVVTGNPCAGKTAGAVCGATPSLPCAAAPTCQPKGVGNALKCTANVKAAGAPCRSSGGDCDPGETCNGVSDTCPADAVAPATTVCRPAAGPCDTAETCDGSGRFCPANGYLTGTVCAAAGVCQTDGICSGAAASCPGVGLAAAATPCDDGDPTTSGDACNGAGVCIGIATATCNPAGAPFGGGTGTAADPFLICTESHLRATHDIDAWFEQTQDIALSPIAMASYVGTLKGRYDGAGYRLTGLSIVDGTLNNVGLFGIVYNGASVKDLVLVDANVSLTGGNIVGTLAGYVCGPYPTGGLCNTGPSARISGVTVSGVITGNANNVGGLVGQNWGVIEDCVTDVDITGGGSTLGGLVGQNMNAHEASTGLAVMGSIFRSHAHGDVVGLDTIGGAIGVSRGQAFDCSATGNVTGRNAIGGFAAVLRGSDQNRSPDPVDPSTGFSIYPGYTEAKTQRCWATGRVDSYGQIAGGFAGASERMFVSQCWSTGDVGTGPSYTPQGRTGGFVGEVGGNLFTVAATRPGEVRDCWSRGAVRAQGVRNFGSAGREVGGFVGSTNMSIRQLFTSVTLAPTVEITVGGNSLGLPFDPLGGGFFGGGYSNVNTDRNLNNNFSACWWLRLDANRQDAGLCTYPNYTVRCPVATDPANPAVGDSEGPSPENLYGIEAAEIPADGSTPANWSGLDFSATGAWTMAANTGSLSAYAGPVPVLKVQCGHHGVTCL